MRNNFVQKLFTCLLVFSVVIGVSISKLEAKPGTNEDPLVSRSYVDTMVRFKPFSLQASTSIKLSSGSEIVITSPNTGLIESSSGDLMLFIDLSEGKRADSKGLLPYHHYLLASPNDIVFKFNNSISGFIRGNLNP